MAQVIRTQPGNIWDAVKDAYNNSIFGHIIAPGIGNLWNDITGKTNTETQNSAAATLQEDAQAFNSAESAAQRDWESAEAQKNREWQEYMSNTAVQRSAADFKAAGFNPILATGNAAATGSPISAVGSTASSAVAGAQASNVNLLASIGTAAAGMGILIKAIKALK